MYICIARIALSLLPYTHHIARFPSARPPQFVERYLYTNPTIPPGVHIPTVWEWQAVSTLAAAPTAGYNHIADETEH